MSRPGPLAALAASLALAGCSYSRGHAELTPDGHLAALDLTSLNFVNDRGLDFSRTDASGTAVSLAYSNTPNATATAAAFAAVQAALAKIPSPSPVRTVP